MPTATANVKGGFFEQYGTTMTSSQGSGFHRRKIAQLLGTKGMMDDRALIRALNGVAPGAAATKTLTRVANSTELGGVRAIETETIINRATVAGDVTTLNTDLFTYTGATTMASPANKDGNPLGTR